MSARCLAWSWVAILATAAGAVGASSHSGILTGASLIVVALAFRGIVRE